MYSGDIREEFSDNFLSYAASVNWDRAIPRAQDGLKPVARRILWAMYKGKYDSSKAEVKCARIVGDVMGQYHPHGDSSIYEAMIRLAKEWIMRYPLIDVHGNKGNVGGDGPAAQRYTESRTTKLVEDSCFDLLKKKVVEMQPNYDETLEEPTVLPSVFPNLLCSPNQGIGVAQACTWLPHNLNEIADIIISYSRTGELDYSNLYPDFPLGGTIVNPQDVKSIYSSGKGKVVVEGKYKIENDQIIFYEQPYEVTTEALVDKLKEQYEAGKLTQIADFQDQSGKKGFRLVFDLVTGADKDRALTEIFSFSDLRKSYSANCVAIRDMLKGPELLTLKDCIDVYIEHNTNCILKEHEYDFGIATARIEILEGLLKAISVLDKVIYIVRNSNTAKQDLISDINLTEKQAQAVLDMKLGRLSKLEEAKLEKELQEKKEFAEYCESVISSKEKQAEILCERLQELVKKYGDQRRTNVEQREIKKIAAATKEKAAEAPIDVVVTFDDRQYLRVVPVGQYKKVKNALNEFKMTNKHLVLAFSNLGKMYRIGCKDIGMSAGTDKGRIISTIINAEKGEKILYCTSTIVDEKRPYITSITNNGKIKKTDHEKLVGTTRNLNGIKYIGLDSNEVTWCSSTNGDFVSIEATDGYCLSFDLADVGPTGATSKGVIGIKLNENAEVKRVELNKHVKTGLVLTKRAGKGRKL